MDLDFSDEQHVLREMVRGVCAEYALGVLLIRRVLLHGWWSGAIPRRRCRLWWRWLGIAQC